MDHHTLIAAARAVVDDYRRTMLTAIRPSLVRLERALPGIIRMALTSDDPAVRRFTRKALGATRYRRRYARGRR